MTDENIKVARKAWKTKPSTWSRVATSATRY